MSPCKLLVIGHDGLDLEELENNSYPTIEDLASSGSLVRMKSEYRSTVPSWMSIYTGLTEKEHKSGGGWEEWIKRRYRRPVCYWDKFNERGYSTGVFSMPMTYPPSEVDGWMVSGFPVAFDNIGLTYPESLEEFMGDYISDITQPVMVSRGLEEPAGFGMTDVAGLEKLGPEKIIRKTIDSKIATLDKILTSYPVDVVSIGFSFLDHAIHLHCPVEQACSMIDYSISESLRITEPEKVVIVSDHGLNHTENGVLLTSIKIPEQDYREWEVADVILGMLK